MSSEGPNPAPNTVCPRNLGLFYIVYFYMEWVLIWNELRPPGHIVCIEHNYIFHSKENNQCLINVITEL